MDYAFAVAVYGREGGVMSQLCELKAWFEARTVFHFY
jgi:inositol-polyphosphate multikinase